MKLVREKKSTVQQKLTKSQEIETQLLTDKKWVPVTISNQSFWKILIVDDEPEVHAVTKLSVGNLEFANKKLRLLNAMSAAEAKEILAKESNIAVALIDVVMETEDAGLRLVDYIRNTLNNQHIRLIIRTGQPGAAPEREVIDHYDIDDYKDKTELTAQRLYTMLKTTLKAYRDMAIIETNRLGLEKIITAAPDLYRIQPMEQFIEGILTQITSLCNIGENSLIATINGVLAVPAENSKVVVRAGTGKFTNNQMNFSQVEAIIQTCELLLRNEKPVAPLAENSLLLPLVIYDKIIGFIYLEDVGFLSENDKYLIKIMASQCASALKNLQLYLNLEEANRQNALKNHFLGMAAHDLRNPIGVVEGYASLLAIKISDAEQSTYIKQIKKTSQFMLTLVNNLLDVAQIEAGKLELDLTLTDFISLITQGISLNRPLADTKQIQLKCHYDEDIPQIKVDASRIEQVMNNLISNAIKYSYPQTTINTCITKNENALVLSVKDEGQGIPENEIGKLFQPFSKTSVKSTAGEVSTGLGLLICRQIVEAHQGQIWVESQVEVGSTFYVSLPIER